VNILQTLVRYLKECGKLDLFECFIEGFFVVAKKGGRSVGKTKRGIGTKVMAVADRSGLPIAIHIAPAAPQSAHKGMKSPMWKQLSHLDLSWKLRNG
jgi:hypothetical protein